MALQAKRMSGSDQPETRHDKPAPLDVPWRFQVVIEPPPPPEPWLLEHFFPGLRYLREDLQRPPERGPRRRIPSFRLRTLILVVLLIAVVSGAISSSRETWRRRYFVSIAQLVHDFNAQIAKPSDGVIEPLTVEEVMACVQEVQQQFETLPQVSQEDYYAKYLKKLQYATSTGYIPRDTELLATWIVDGKKRRRSCHADGISFSLTPDEVAGHHGSKYSIVLNEAYLRSYRGSKWEVPLSVTIRSNRDAVRPPWQIEAELERKFEAADTEIATPKWKNFPQWLDER